MAIVKKDKKKEAEDAPNADGFWRKPITLDSLEGDDPLETLYRGREVGGSEKAKEVPIQPTTKKTVKPAVEKAQSSAGSVESAIKPSKPAVKKEPAKTKVETGDAEKKPIEARSPKVSEEELKNILKIKSDSFQFTDIREILRGKSYDIYAYLRFLSGDSGVCKIKHLDLMRELDISRPTLFKQGDWLTRLSLIEKRSVPGDHLGTSYTVHRLEEVLPVSETLIRQIQTEIEKFASQTVIRK